MQSMYIQAKLILAYYALSRAMLSIQKFDDS